MKLRSLWAGLLVLQAVILTACSTGGQEQSMEDGVETLVYATLNPSSADREAVEQFNSRHKDIKIELKNYTLDSESGKQGLDRLMVEIAAGQVPDIIDLGWSASSPILLPYRQLAEKGYLENLWPYIESDPELGREGIVEAPLKAAEVNGGLYTIFESVAVRTLIGAESMVGSRTSWSLAELRETFSGMPEGSTVIEYWVPRRGVFECTGYMFLEEFVDWGTGQCFFDSGRFQSFLEFINGFPPEIDYSAGQALSEEAAKRQLAGLQMLSLGYIASFSDVPLLNLMHGGRAAYIGYPVEDGSVGSSFIPSKVKFSMSSTCRNKEAAWEFIRQILLPRSSSNGWENNVGLDIPVNRAEYEKMKNRAMQEKKPEITLFDGGPQIDPPLLSREESQRFEAFFDSIDKIELSTDTIYNIVYEASGPYFAGDKALDETADLVQNRVSLYVKENM